MDENDGIGALVDDFFKKEMVCGCVCGCGFGVVRMSQVLVVAVRVCMCRSRYQVTVVRTTAVM